jgi:plasmid stabilization system protein ParE
MVKKKLKIIWDDEAKRSLRNIYNYIKSRESAEVARKVRNEIISQTKSLNDFPEKFEKEHHMDDEPGNFR